MWVLRVAVQTMPEAIITLHQWLSPAFPVGGFSYSHGIETAVAVQMITDAALARDWIETALVHGAGQSDAILLAAAWRSLPDDLGELIGLARALAPSSERLLESDRMGASFARIVRDLHGIDLRDAPYPVAFGCAARLMDFPLNLTLDLFVQAFVANLVSAAVRLVPLGQTEGQRITLSLAPMIQKVAHNARQGDVDQIANTAVRIDLASMQHETLTTRLFQS